MEVIDVLDSDCEQHLVRKYTLANLGDYSINAHREVVRAGKKKKGAGAIGGKFARKTTRKKKASGAKKGAGIKGAAKTLIKKVAETVGKKVSTGEVGETFIKKKSAGNGAGQKKKGTKKLEGAGKDVGNFIKKNVDVGDGGNFIVDVGDGGSFIKNLKNVDVGKELYEDILKTLPPFLVEAALDRKGAHSYTVQCTVKECSQRVEVNLKRHFFCARNPPAKAPWQSGGMFEGWQRVSCQHLASQWVRV